MSSAHVLVHKKGFQHATKVISFFFWDQDPSLLSWFEGLRAIQTQSGGAKHMNARILLGDQVTFGLQNSPTTNTFTAGHERRNRRLSYTKGSAKSSIDCGDALVIIDNPSRTSKIQEWSWQALTWPHFSDWKFSFSKPLTSTPTNSPSTLTTNSASSYQALQFQVVYWTKYAFLGPENNKTPGRSKRTKQNHHNPPKPNWLKINTKGMLCTGAI
jgi:hypothetical protein